MSTGRSDEAIPQMRFPLPKCVKVTTKASFDKDNTLRVQRFLFVHSTTEFSIPLIRQLAYKVLGENGQPNSLFHTEDAFN